jgi:hypothetical protein
MVHLRCKQGNEPRKQRFSVYLSQQDSVRRLYCHHPDQYLDQRAMSPDINTKWHNFKAVIIKTVTEVLWRSCKRIRKKRIDCTE